MRRRSAFDITVTVVCLSLLGFFAWHGMYGKRSFANQDAILAKMSGLEQKRDALRVRREALETRVSLLRPESIDPDMLEEMSRKMLGFAKANEIVVRD